MISIALRWFLSLVSCFIAYLY